MDFILFQAFSRVTSLKGHESLHWKELLFLLRYFYYEKYRQTSAGCSYLLYGDDTHKISHRRGSTTDREHLLKQDRNWHQALQRKMTGSIFSLSATFFAVSWSESWHRDRSFSLWRIFLNFETNDEHLAVNWNLTTKMIKKEKTFRGSKKKQI
jgi:hypothetical protein